MKYHLAQANIARFRAKLDDPIMKEFVSFLEPVNQFAEQSDGFIWRLKDEAGRSASYIQSPFNDELMAVNISVWRDLPSFKAFVYGSVHHYFLRNKTKWFDRKGPSQFVLWWMPEGELPTLELAKEKLNLVSNQGVCPEAFTLKHFFDWKGNPVPNP